MTDLRQAAQQALEALGSGNPYHQQLAAKVLRTALEQQAEPFSPEVINTTQTAWKMGYEAAKAEQQQAEPVAWVLEWIENGEQKHHRLYDDKQKCFRDAESDGGVCRPLVYCDTPPQRKPLPDKELNLIGAKWHYNLLSKDDKAELFAFVRAAIEAARGIGDKT